jgi:prophage regulatory protein
MSKKKSINGRRPASLSDADANALRFIPMKEVSRRVGYTPQHIRRLIDAGAFPSYVPLGPNKIGFVEAEVTAWQRARIAQRDAKRGKGEGEGGASAPALAPRPVSDGGAGSVAKA